jgi:hypothetical protein
MPTKKSDSSGLPPEMPRCPGDRKAGQPPSRAELGGALPSWLDSKNAAWPRERVAAVFGPYNRRSWHRRPAPHGPPRPTNPRPPDHVTLNANEGACLSGK